MAVKRQPSMTDRMLVGQKLNFKELHDDDIRRQVLLHDTPYMSDIHPQCHSFLCMFQFQGPWLISVAACLLAAGKFWCCETFHRWVLD